MQFERKFKTPPKDSAGEKEIHVTPVSPDGRWWLTLNDWGSRKEGAYISHRCTEVKRSQGWNTNPVLILYNPRDGDEGTNHQSYSYRGDVCSYCKRRIPEESIKYACEILSACALREINPPKIKLPEE